MTHVPAARAVTVALIAIRTPAVDLSAVGGRRNVGNIRRDRNA